MYIETISFIFHSTELISNASRRKRLRLHNPYSPHLNRICPNTFGEKWPAFSYRHKGNRQIHRHTVPESISIFLYVTFGKHETLFLNGLRANKYFSVVRIYATEGKQTSYW